MSIPNDGGGPDRGGAPDDGISGGIPDDKTSLAEARAEVDHERQSGEETTAVYGDTVDGIKRGVIPNRK